MPVNISHLQSLFVRFSVLITFIKLFNYTQTAVLITIHSFSFYNIYNYKSIIMPSSNTSNTVIFDEGQGYFLVKALTHGQKAQSYITRSLSDGNLYARKKLIADYVNLVPPSSRNLPRLFTLMKPYSRTSPSTASEEKPT